MTDTAILEEIHGNLAQRRMNLAERKATFQQAWEQRHIALLETQRMPRITGDLGDPNATRRMPIAAGISRPVVQHLVICQIGRAVDRFYLEQGSAPEVVVCWAMDILLLGTERIEIKTDVVDVDVELITESQLRSHVSNLICGSEISGQGCA